jgi:RNA polymerase sigma-70 factor (ECF subfamily)
MAILDGPEVADPVRVGNRLPGTEGEPYYDWVGLLSTPGPGHANALAKLHELLLRAARHQVFSMYGRMPTIGDARREDLVNQAADEAMIAVLGKLSTFQGRSRFTTWAYKFGILAAAVEVRRSMWRNREVPLDLLPEPAATDHSAEQMAEAADFSDAVSHAIAEALTAHQREVVLALIVDDVPIDVLAERLGTNRNAVYKTLHDARGRLRTRLSENGYLAATNSKGVIR